MKKFYFSIFFLSLFILFIACGNTTISKVQFVQGDNQIDVMVDGKLFTSYKYDFATLTKPVLFPVISPSGVEVNRSFPFKEVEGESKDHPHHTGIFFTYDEVNDNGFWNNTTFPPQILHIESTKMANGDTGKLSTLMHWVDKNENPLLKEERTMEFIPGKNSTSIDFTITLTAMDEKVVFKDTKEGMFAIRVAHWLKEKGNENSQYRSSNGDVSEKNIWGKRAKWVILEGKKDGKTIGIAILNHPESVNYPTFWHARAYGLFAANPLGQSVFQKGRGEETPEPFNLTLEPGKSALFKFRVIIYEGVKSDEQLESVFSEYSG